jgi:hypothetical protein
VERACFGKDGVARIRVNTSDMNVFESVASAFGIKFSFYNHDNQVNLVELLDAASALEGGDWVPTIVAEIDRSASPGTVENVSKALNVFVYLFSLSLLMQWPRVLYWCLATLTPLFSLTQDPARQEFIWVGNYTREEANKYLLSSSSTRSRSEKMYFNKSELWTVVKIINNRRSSSGLICCGCIPKGGSYLGETTSREVS